MSLTMNQQAVECGPVSSSASSTMDCSGGETKRSNINNMLCNRKKRRSSAAVMATAAVALVTISSGTTAVAAFGGGPLQPGASGRITPVKTSGKSTAKNIGPVPAGRNRRNQPPRPDDDHNSVRGSSPPPPPLRMAVTDPETLLGEELAELRRRRRGRQQTTTDRSAARSSGSPRRRSSRPTSATSRSGSRSRSPCRGASRANIVDTRILNDPGSIYFGFGHQHRALVELGIGLDGSPALKQPKEEEEKEEEKKDTTKANSKANLGFEVPSPPTPRPPRPPPQIIEADLEVVEPPSSEKDAVLPTSAPAASLASKAKSKPSAKKVTKKEKDITKATAKAKTTARSFKPVSSTPSEQTRSANARRSTTTASRKKKSTSSASDAAASAAAAAVPTRSKKKVVSKSSTMPGFQQRNKNLSGRRRAHRDGVRIAEQRSGKDLSKIVNKETTAHARKKANSDAMYKSSASVPDSLIAFTEEIHKVTERITPTEEIELGTKTQEAIRLQNLYTNLEQQLEREPTDDEWCAAAGKINTEALKTAIEDGMEAKNRLVEANLRMVQGVVNLYIRNGLGSQYNAGDLMQEGTMALIRAAEKFEPERGLRFSTYAMYWIRAAVKRSQIVQSRVIQVPQRLHETHKRVQKVQKELKGELGRPPTKDELAPASNLSRLQLDRCQKAMSQKCFSLDATIKNNFKPGTGGDRKETMYDIVNGKFEDEQYRKTQQQLVKDALISTIRGVLSTHEVDLLLLRYGLMDERTLPHGFAGPLTIAEVSRLVGLKPDKVRRMINKCLAKLRPVMQSNWEDYESKIIL